MPAGGRHPDPVRAAQAAAGAGADGITAHLREDRRHIADPDIVRLIEEIDLAAYTWKWPRLRRCWAIALRHGPHAACIVPEKREDRHDRRRLNVVQGHNHLAPYVRALQEAGIRVSLFIEPEREALDAAVALGAPVVELHTGSFCEADLDGDAAARARDLLRLVDAADHAERIGLECHAGHGLTFDTVGDVAAIPDSRRTQYRPLPGRRSDLRRSGKRDQTDAQPDGQSPRRGVRRAQRLSAPARRRPVRR